MKKHICTISKPVYAVENLATGLADAFGELINMLLAPVLALFGKGQTV